jgi:hypothetical protein
MFSYIVCKVHHNKNLYSLKVCDDTNGGLLLSYHNLRVIESLIPKKFVQVHNVFIDGRKIIIMDLELSPME